MADWGDPRGEGMGQHSELLSGGKDTAVRRGRAAENRNNRRAGSAPVVRNRSERPRVRVRDHGGGMPQGSWKCKRKFGFLAEDLGKAKGSPEIMAPGRRAVWRAAGRCRARAWRARRKRGSWWGMRRMTRWPFTGCWRCREGRAWETGWTGIFETERGEKACAVGSKSSGRGTQSAGARPIGEGAWL